MTEPNYRIDHRNLRIPYEVERMKDGVVVGRGTVSGGSPLKVTVKWPDKRTTEMTWSNLYNHYRPTKR